MPTYNKLVRDRIPAIIQASGKECKFTQLAGADLINALEKKLQEEMLEFTTSNHDLEELADILEVVDALAVRLGSSFQDIIALKEEKKNKRGGFDKGIWLKWVED